MARVCRPHSVINDNPGVFSAIVMGAPSMDEQGFQSRLSRIATRWTMLRKAHGPVEDDVQAAQAALFERYQRAIYGYLVTSLRDHDAADEVFQEFAVKFLSGGFRRADPSRGRFRDYLKTAIIRLMVDYRRKLARENPHFVPEAPELEAPAEEANPSESFDSVWRDELLTRAWKSLEAHEQETGQPYHAVLHYRTQHPDQSSAEMAEGLTAQLTPERPYTSAAVRKTLQRAREKFADLLIAEVAASLETGEPDAIEEELIDLGLVPYCRSAVQRLRG